MAAHPISRRRGLLAGAAALVGGASTPSVAAPAATGEPQPGALPWMREQGAQAGAHPYGVPSPFERNVIRRMRGTVAFPTAASTGTPLQDLHGIITPNGLHYERHHAGVPQIDPDAHRLLIHGLVDRPLILTMDDILRFPSVSRLHFLECSGNTPEYRDARPGWTPQDTHGLLSCCEWTGVPLATLLAEVGAQDAARWILAEGADPAAMTRQHPDRKILGRCDHCLRAERRSASAGARVSVAPVSAWF